MSALTEKLANLMMVLPIIIFVTFTNVIIASVLAGVTFLQLMAVAGWHRGPSLVVAILVAIAVHAYITLQPTIRNYISARSKYE